jgi:POT family proton-dependent oligopeptide transporter
LIISAIPGVIEGKGSLGAFLVGIIVTGFGVWIPSHFCFPLMLNAPLYTGTGLFKSNISPLIAEQYKRTKQFVITTKSGEKVIVDPSLTISRMYMVR